MNPETKLDELERELKELDRDIKILAWSERIGSFIIILFLIQYMYFLYHGYGLVDVKVNILSVLIIMIIIWLSRVSKSTNRLWRELNRLTSKNMDRK